MVRRLTLQHEMNWLQLNNPESVISPSLLVDPGRVAQNIQQMIAMVGGVAHVGRLRPHVKTHKMPDVTRMQIDAGIHRFKTATIAETEMVAAAGATDVLLAYQPVGPNLGRLADLIQRFPATCFAAITDDLSAAKEIAGQLGRSENPFRLFIDVDCGMHRTGIELGDSMERLRDWIESEDGVRFEGLHVYDGHIHDESLDARRKKATAIISQIRDYDQARPSTTIIGSGSPTFGIWASETSWQCSPGTMIFWDFGYGNAHPDLEFSIAAALLTRVISKPGKNRLCLDLGYKAVASETPEDGRVVFPSLGQSKIVGHNEEHLVIETPAAESIPVGEALIGFPRHICPTVALHASAFLVRDGRATGESWRISARDR